jgi:membrane protease YdiL (CAAX protease family)
MTRVMMAVLVLAGATAYSFRPAVAGTARMWLGLTLPYAALCAVTVRQMHRDGVLRDRFRFRSGDVTLGAVMAAALLGAAWLVEGLWFPPDAAARAWVFRLLLQIGTPTDPLFLPSVALMGVMEEIVWRGLVLDALAHRVGTRRAWPLAAVAYAAAHLPTAWTLADPDLGPNPLLIVAALGAGLVWGAAASTLGRLPPVVISHVVFGSFAPAMMLPSLGGS